jgi:hypothetical protein
VGLIFTRTTRVPILLSVRIPKTSDSAQDEIALRQQIRIAEPVLSVGNDILRLQTSTALVNSGHVLPTGTRLDLANLLNMSGCEHSGTCAMKAPEMLGKRSL